MNKSTNHSYSGEINMYKKSVLAKIGSFLPKEMAQRSFHAQKSGSFDGSAFKKPVECRFVQ